MQRIDTPTTAADLFGQGKAGFSDGNVFTGTPATALNAAWFNSVQEELCKVVEAAGLVPDPNDRTQVYQALQLMFGQQSDPVEPAVPEVPPGAVAHFARNTAPVGWLKCNGAAVSRTTYAALFAVVGTTFGAGDGNTTFQLPDLRGEFLRGLDDGRGVDGGRGLGSAQADALQGHWHQVFGNFATNDYSGNGGIRNAVTTVNSGNSVDYTDPYKDIRNPVSDGANGTPRTASETRPRNVALLACIKY